jgi:hypothetical protein
MAEVIDRKEITRNAKGMTDAQNHTGTFANAKLPSKNSNRTS